MNDKGIKTSHPPNVICLSCGKEFYCPQYYIKRGGGKYCSQGCFGRSIVGKANTGWVPKIEKICLWCGKHMNIYPSQQRKGKKFCSRQCLLMYVNARKVKNTKQLKRSVPGWRSHRYKGGDIETKCASCGKMFYAKRSAANKGQGRFCSQECWGREMAKIMRGKTHTTARGGKRADLDNQYFRSSWEANWARYLNWLISIGEISKWEYEPDTYEFIEIKKGTRFYTPDFKITNKDGAIEYQEIKGYMDDRSRIKLNRMSRYYPNIKVVVIDAEQYRFISKQVKNLVPNWEIAEKHSW